MRSAVSQPGASSTTPSSNEPWREVLDCTVGKARIGVPAEVVDTVLELELAPAPPLARRWVGGLGHHQARVVLCVSLVPPAEAAGPRRLTRGVLFKVPHSELRWMLEVGQVRAFHRVQASGPRVAPAESPLPGWIVPAVTADRHPVGLLDVEAMVRELAGTA